MSAEFLTVLTTPLSMEGPVAFACLPTNGAVLLWVDDHLLCDEAHPTAPLPAPEEAPLPPFMVLSAGQEYFIRLRFAHNSSSVGNASIALLWAPAIPGAPRPSPAQSRPLPTAALTQPGATHPQSRRISMQRDVATGWGTWWRPSALAATLLPEGATVTVGLCQHSTADCMNPGSSVRAHAEAALAFRPSITHTPPSTTHRDCIRAGISG